MGQLRIDTVILDGEITRNVPKRLLSFIYVSVMVCAYGEWLNGELRIGELYGRVMILES